jgi:hypothetical protein
MKKTRQTKRTKRLFRYLVLAGILIFIASSTASYLFFKPLLAFKSPLFENIETRQTDDEPDKSSYKNKRLYLSGGKHVSDSDKFSRSAFLATAEDVIKRYMEPLKVALLDLYMDTEGTIYADFNSELRKRFQGDAFEEYRIIADLYKRLRLNIPDFISLKILIEGKESESFGGHILISKPIGKKIEGKTRRKTDNYF